MENSELEDEASWLEKEMADMALVNDRHEGRPLSDPEFAIPSLVLSQHPNRILFAFTG